MSELSVKGHPDFTTFYYKYLLHGLVKYHFVSYVCNLIYILVINS